MPTCLNQNYDANCVAKRLDGEGKTNLEPALLILEIVQRSGKRDKEIDYLGQKEARRVRGIGERGE